MFFLLLHIIKQHSKLRIDILLIAPLFNVSMGVIEFLLQNLISHKQEKPLLHKYVVAVVGIRMRTKIAYFAMLLYSGTFSSCTQNSVYDVSLNSASMSKSD